MPSIDNAQTHVETAGAFDIRMFIGTLIGLFGLALTLMGIFAFNAAESAKTGGMNANLWAGIGMLIGAAVFIAWAKLRPIRILVQPNDPDADQPLDLAPAE